MTRVATSFGLAFVNAAAIALKSQGKAAPWPARRVALNAEHTTKGTKEIPAVTVHCSSRTARSIMDNQGVDVRS